MKQLLRYALIAVAAPLWAAADPQLLALLPANAKMMAGLDVAGVKATPLGQYAITRLAQGTGVKELDNMTGFDPRTDLLEVLAASSSGLDDIVIVARGAFEPAKLQGLLKPAGVHRGSDIFALGPEGMVAAFPNATLAVIGVEKQVTGVIDRWIDGGSAPTPLSADAVKASEKAQLWVTCNDLTAANAIIGQPKDMQGQMVAGLVKTLVKITAGLTFGSDMIDARSQITARSAEDAKGLADLLRLLTGMAPKDFPLPVTALQLAAEGDTVTASISIPEKLVEQLLGQ